MHKVQVWRGFQIRLDIKANILQFHVNNINESQLDIII